jgi:bifunctional non-homologous end joining protein LigD
MIIAGATILGLNKKGQEVPLPNSIVKSNTNICILDGEIISDKLFVFDMLSANGNSMKDLPYSTRLKFLNTLTFGKGIEIVKTAYTKKEKQKLYDELKKRNAEGIVFKKKDSLYQHGRPASGGDHLKHKFYKTATFIVRDATNGKRSVGLELVSNEDNSRVFMGKVTIPPNHDVPNKGELVEVRYLYAYKGGAVFQPTYLGKRNDSDLTDATMKQIVYKEGQE